MNETPELVFTEPTYIVLFPSRAASGGRYRPLVSAAETGRQYLNGHITLPLGLDRDLEPILPAAWYCLHLPRSRFDFSVLGAIQWKTLQGLNLPLRVLLMPTPHPKGLVRELAGDGPKLIFAPDDLLEDARALGAQLDDVVDIAPTSTLGPARLASDWAALYTRLRVPRPQDVQPSELIPQSTSRSLLLSTHVLMRQFAGGLDSRLPPTGLSCEGAVGTSLELQALLSALERMERLGREGGAPESPRESFPPVLEEERRRFRCPVVIGLRGVSPSSQGHQLRRRFERKGLARHDDAALEHEAIDLAVAHRALCRSGVSLGTIVIPEEAFRHLGELERSWAKGSASPRSVWRFLARMTRASAPAFDEPTTAALRHATSVTCFSEFPLGLLSLPDGSEPLASDVPVVYRPIVPLTRCLQIEMLNMPSIDLSSKLRILVAECLSTDDLVGRLSRTGWAIGLENFRRTPNVQARFVEVSDVPHLKRVLSEDRYDIAVISAHGFVDLDRGQAGFICGEQRVSGDELSRLPPVVCLSACHVAPRGDGTVNVTDLLFRAGARVVFGTLVPIDVRRNALLMTRLFVYLAETLRGETGMRTLLDVWHHTIVTNTVNDVLRATPAVDEWAHEGRRETSVLVEFMNTRSRGRLRTGSIYADTVAVLEEIARDRGKEDWFRASLQSHGYLPESLFYVALGWPEQIILHDPRRGEARRRYEPLLSPKVRVSSLRDPC